MFIERRFHSPDLRRKGLFGRTRLQVSAVVELENLEKSYRLGKVTVNALRGVTLKLWRAEFMVIMGPSGSGKTTLLNIIGTLDKPSSGRALVDGEDITRMNDAQLTRLRRHKIGFVFQFHNLIPVLFSFSPTAYDAFSPVSSWRRYTYASSDPLIISRIFSVHFPTSLAV